MKRILCLALCLLYLGMPAARGTAVAWGSRGEQVKLIQQKLKQYGYFNGAVDGVFGKETYDAVVYFQRKNGLKADGAVGQATAAALGVTLSNGAVAAANPNESETYLLARLIHGEARGEPYVGKVAVGAVVLNRVKSASFPDSIAGVVYQKGAFSAVTDGQFDQPVSSTSLKAARDAMAGWDPSGGALYYYNPAKTSNAWMHSRPVITTIGNHRFCS